MIEIKSPSVHTPRGTTAKSHRDAVERVVTFLRREQHEPLSLEAMAQRAFLSPFHFNRVFRQLTGVPPGQFHSALRLQTAKRLLLTTELSVFDVCFEVGYKSPSTFARRFTDLIGVSPHQWRSQALAVVAFLPALIRSAELLRTGSGGVTARVAAPEGIEGPIFAGLFPRATPQGRPVECAALARPGRLDLPPVPDGDYYLFAAALPTAQDPSLAMLCGDEMLRSGAGGQRIRVRGGQGTAADLTLRLPDLIDPPLLLAFPLLAAARLGAG